MIYFREKIQYTMQYWQQFRKKKRKRVLDLLIIHDVNQRINIQYLCTVEAYR
jgi:hypothetical protein